MLLLSLVVALAAEAAPAAGTTTITIYYPVVVGKPVAKAIDAVNAAFMQSRPDITVRAVYTDSYAGAESRALAALGTADPPQAMVALAANLFDYIDRDLVAAFSDVADQPDDYKWYNHFYAGFLKNSRHDRKVYGIPFARSTVIMAYNQSAFLEAGLDPRRPPGSWQELAAVARRLTRRRADGSVERWGLLIPAGTAPYWMLQAFVAQNDATLASEDGTRTTFDSPAVVEALQCWLDLAKEGATPPGVTGWNEAPAEFVAGRAAMIWTSTGFFTTLHEGAAFPFALAALPKGKVAGTPTGGGNLYLFKSASEAQRRAVVAYARFVTQPEREAQWSIDTGYAPASPYSWVTPGMEQFLLRFPSYAEVRKQLPVAQNELSTHASSKVYQALNRELIEALNGRKSAAAALRDAQSEAEKALQPFR